MAKLQSDRYQSDCFHKIWVKQLKLPLWIFQNKLSSDFYLTYIIPWSTMKVENMKNLSEAKVRQCFPKQVKFHFYPVFGLISNFIARFMYEDDVTTS